jgi:ABC-type nitrate/sulfonate/bicarbonate transport system substrate-binding protein
VRGTFSRRDLLSRALGASIIGPRLGRAAAASGAPASGAATAPVKAAVPINIANAGGGLNLTLTALMRRMKFFESFGLAPTVLQVSDGSKVLGAVVNGSVDASFESGFGQVFPAIERGAALKIIAGGALIPTTALFTGKPDIRSLKDLEGRTVGAGAVGALVYQLVVTLLRKYHVDVSKVKFVNVGSSPDIFRAVAVGTVDAGTAAGGMISEAERYRVRLIPHGNLALELPRYTSQGAWTSDRKIATSRELLVRGLAAQARLYRFVQTPEARGPFIEARRSVFPAAEASDHEAEWNFITTYRPFAVDLLLSPERIDYMQQLNVGFNVQGAVLPFERVADMSLAADALKLL